MKLHETLSIELTVPRITSRQMNRPNIVTSVKGVRIFEYTGWRIENETDAFTGSSVFLEERLNVDFVFEGDTSLAKNHVNTCSPLGGGDTNPKILNGKGLE
ncbi:unnamed protein product [Acanthoscelides obtectus]|uniref:Uncharacterized protein n=1 Tax=Acanthoscelides obtectus TaxID=200917 RepID=A0A9P0PQR9_ACAOB|nr:unnamed protein product [Acanthoscelides obtectus]CAK1682013.1 hypothetical protein AOBTE_LOCUS33374 [Acanthoscelides obtectus]